jgi:hypothetical protein
MRPYRGARGRIARAVATSAALFALLLTLAGPALAQLSGPRPGFPRPFAPDPIDQSRALSTRPLPSVGPVPQPAERYVPERRVTVPGTGREIIVPGHTERAISGTQAQVPTLPTYSTNPTGPFHIYGGDRPPAELRQGP